MAHMRNFHAMYAHKPSHFANGEGEIHLAKVNRNTFAKLAKVKFRSNSLSCRTNILVYNFQSADFSRACGARFTDNY